MPDSPAFGLMASAAAIAGALVSLIIAFGNVSGGHFNPLITGLQCLGGERSLNCTIAYIAAQILGALSGAWLAEVAFGNVMQQATPIVIGWRVAVSEVFASAGLMTIVFGCSRSGRKDIGPFAVGAWIASAIIATPSTSYANPAVTIAALFAAGPIALSRGTVLYYVPAEIAGALIGYFVIAIAYPRRDCTTIASDRIDV